MNRKFMAVMMSAVLMAGTAGTTMPVFAAESEAEQEDSGFLGSLLGGGGLSSLFRKTASLGNCFRTVSWADFFQKAASSPAL